MLSLKDRVVLITGAGTGVGYAIAKGFVDQGAKVVLIGRRLVTLEAAAKGFPADRIMTLACDVSDRPAVGQIVSQVLERFGTVDILVNNAGINVNPRMVAEIDPSDWDSVIHINLTGIFNVIRAVLPVMREKKNGVIVNISSIAGIRGSKLTGAAYSASKHGVVALSNTLNEEEVDYNIRSCTICPGEIDTPILDRRPQPPSSEHRARILKPEDIAATVLFVASCPPRVCIPLLVIKPTTQIFR